MESWRVIGSPDKLGRYSPLIERPEWNSGRYSLKTFMYFGYILYSKLLDKYYVGHTQDLNDRIFRHNNSGSKYTKVAKDWELKYSIEFSLRSEAMQWEKIVKGKKSRVFIENLIKG